MGCEVLWLAENNSPQSLTAQSTTNDGINGSEHVTHAKPVHYCVLNQHLHKIRVLFSCLLSCLVPHHLPSSHKPIIHPSILHATPCTLQHLVPRKKQVSVGCLSSSSACRAGGRELCSPLLSFRRSLVPGGDRDLDPISRTQLCRASVTFVTVLWCSSLAGLLQKSLISHR
jgi:hypothetical protein